jgi:hypothetical protein
VNRCSLRSVVCVPAPVTRFPGSESGPCVAGPHSPWSRPLAPPAPQRIAPPCSPASHYYYGRVRLPTFVHHRLRFSLPDADQSGLPWPSVGSPKFRRDPFARDVLFDPGRVDRTSHNGPVHVAFDHFNSLCPCDRPFRGSITHPTQPLCTLRGRRYRRLTQHSLPGRLLGLTWAGLTPADRASFAWRLLKFGPASS